MNIPQRDTIGKISAVVQIILFLLLFIGIYLLLRRVVQAWYLRLLILLADYFAVSMLTYLVIRPLAEKIEKKIRK
jgi:antibiotic biosynthesis monooxygenase (ABM) superfamily enzyme